MLICLGKWRGHFLYQEKWICSLSPRGPWKTFICILCDKHLVWSYQPLEIWNCIILEMIFSLYMDKDIQFENKMDPLQSLWGTGWTTLSQFFGSFRFHVNYREDPLFRLLWEHQACQKSYWADIVWYVLVTHLSWGEWVSENIPTTDRNSFLKIICSENLSNNGWSKCFSVDVVDDV